MPSNLFHKRRMRTTYFIKEAINVLKYFPAALNEVTINSILSRCVPDTKVVSEEEKADLTETISHGQDFVDYLEDKEFKYVVLNKTHWRL